MSKLILLGGPTGVGKTTVLRLLEHKLTHAAFLDADDVWRVSNELAVETTRDIALANVITVMRGYFQAGCELGVLSWVFARSLLYEPVIAGLEDMVESVELIYLVATPEVLERRLAERGDLHEVGYAVSRLRLIEALPYEKIDTSEMSTDEVADQLAVRLVT